MVKVAAVRNVSFSNCFISYIHRVNDLSVAGTSMQNKPVPFQTRFIIYLYRVRTVTLKTNSGNIIYFQYTKNRRVICKIRHLTTDWQRTKPHFSDSVHALNVTSFWHGSRGRHCLYQYPYQNNTAHGHALTTTQHNTKGFWLVLSSPAEYLLPALLNIDTVSNALKFEWLSTEPLSNFSQQSESQCIRLSGIVIVVML